MPHLLVLKASPKDLHFLVSTLLSNFILLVWATYNDLPLRAVTSKIRLQKSLSSILLMFGDSCFPHDAASCCTVMCLMLRSPGAACRQRLQGAEAFTPITGEEWNLPTAMWAKKWINPHLNTGGCNLPCRQQLRVRGPTWATCRWEVINVIVSDQYVWE